MSLTQQSTMIAEISFIFLRQNLQENFTVLTKFKFIPVHLFCTVFSRNFISSIFANLRNIPVKTSTIFIFSNELFRGKSSLQNILSAFASE